MSNTHTVLSYEDEDDGDDSKDSIPFNQQLPHANVIESDDSSDANVLIFAAFADRQMGILYSDLTGTFPFMSLEGNMCFLVMHHYESNAILVLPIANFTDGAILGAHQQHFELLESKGHKIQFNMMDNQASKVTKK